MVLKYPQVLSYLGAEINTLTIQNSSFIRNTAPKASSIYVEESALNLVDVSIKGNTTTTANGFIFVKNPPQYDTLHMSITNCVFSENTIEIGLGGIYIETTGFQVTTSIYVEGAVMSNNKAVQGAAIFVNEVKLSEDSYIRSTTFANNEVDGRSVVFLSFVAGIIKIENNTFENNKGEESCIFISS